MRKAKASLKEQAERKLLELWEPGSGFGPPVGCIATTFTFDAAFFEEECLARFAGIQTDPDESDRVYVLEREEKLSQCFAGVIVDQAHVPTLRSLRWQLFSARVPGGIQHAKLSLLVWQRRIRVLIGSANLTPHGYRKNYENVAALEFGPDIEAHVPLEPLEQALAFLETVRELAAGAKSPTGPQGALTRFLAGVRRQIAGWPRPAWPRGEPRVALLAIRPGQPTLFNQLGDLAAGSPYHTARVLSPFFDEADGAKRVVGALEAILARRGERTIWFGAPGAVLADGTIEYGAPEVLREPFLRRISHRFTLINRCALDEHGKPTGEPRALHAKSVWLERDDAAVYCLGSSNFTCAGVGLARRGGNYELNIAYIMLDSGSDFTAICRQTRPPQTELDLQRDEVRFLLSQPVHTTETDAAVGLPIEFGEATFDPGPPGVVRCEIAVGAPDAFSISDADGNVLFDKAQWRALGCPTSVKLPWTSQRPPSHLQVNWGAESPNLVSIWSVNVLDSTLLPPPEELRSLGLEELLHVLTSSRPPYEAVDRMLTRRADAKRASSLEVLDPLHRVDTNGFLLQRMRRFSTALEGLRERLERPVHSREALHWRLAGPFGVTALAQRLAEEDKQGAAFMISELARTVAAAKIPELLT